MAQAPAPRAGGSQGGTAVEITILAGESMSSMANLATTMAVMVFMPEQWTAANITFQVSMDAMEFVDLYDVDGNEVLRPIRPGTAVLIDESHTKYVKYLRVRSGPSANPVPQQDDRTITIVTTLV